MNQKNKILHILLISILTIFPFLELNSFAKDTQHIIFSFAPKDGTTFIQKLTTTREKIFGSAGTQLDESVSATKLTIKMTKEGWDVIAKTISAQMKRNGEVINNPIISLLADITIIYKLDRQGAIIDIVGYEELTALIKARFPDQVAQQLLQLLNSETLKQKEAAEWNGRIGDYVGKTVSINETWEYDVPFTLPNGTSMIYKVRTLFAATKQCGNSQCVRIEQVYDSDAEGTAEIANSVMKSVAETAQPGSSDSVPTIQKSDSSIKGEIIRLIDPTTMLIYHEENQRTMEMKMDIPGVGQVPTKMIEKRVYEFDYKN